MDNEKCACKIKTNFHHDESCPEFYRNAMKGIIKIKLAKLPKCNKSYTKVQKTKVVGRIKILELQQKKNLQNIDSMNCGKPTSNEFEKMEIRQAIRKDDERRKGWVLIIVVALLIAIIN